MMEDDPERDTYTNRVAWTSFRADDLGNAFRILCGAYII